MTPSGIFLIDSKNINAYKSNVTIKKNIFSCCSETYQNQTKLKQFNFEDKEFFEGLQNLLVSLLQGKLITNFGKQLQKPIKVELDTPQKY